MNGRRVRVMVGIPLVIAAATLPSVVLSKAASATSASVVVDAAGSSRNVGVIDDHEHAHNSRTSRVSATSSSRKKNHQKGDHAHRHNKDVEDQDGHHTFTIDSRAEKDMRRLVRRAKSHHHHGQHAGQGHHGDAHHGGGSLMSTSSIALDPHHPKGHNESEGKVENISKSDALAHHPDEEEADREESPALAEKAVRQCDWGPAQVGMYKVSPAAVLDSLDASSAELCKEACCAEAQCKAFNYRKATESCALFTSHFNPDDFHMDPEYVSMLKAEAVSRTNSGQEERYVVITIGGSEITQKCVDAQVKVVCEGDEADASKRLNQAVDEISYAQTFAVTVANGRQVCVQRTDQSAGWTQNLQIQCKQGVSDLANPDQDRGLQAIDSGGGARFFAIRVEPGDQQSIVICEVKLFSDEMENIAPDAMVGIQAHLADFHKKRSPHESADILTDRQFYVPGTQDPADSCLMWHKESAGSLLVTFEFASRRTVTAARLYGVHQEYFGAKAEVLAKATKSSKWKSILSTLPNQGMTVEFDGDSWQSLIPPLGNPACPYCMQDEGFPPPPKEPPHIHNLTKIRLPGPPGPPGDPGPPGKSPEEKSGWNTPVLLLYAGVVLNILIAGFLYSRFRSALREKHQDSVIFDWRDIVHR